MIYSVLACVYSLGALVYRASSAQPNSYTCVDFVGWNSSYYYTVHCDILYHHDDTTDESSY